MSQEHSRDTAHRRSVGEAHGRVNLIGEHTDYNGGLVLPTAIPQRTRVELNVRADRLVRAWSSTHSPDEGYLVYRLGEESRAYSWLDYVQGVTWALSQERVEIGGFDARIDSSVPPGSGLSSSAALEIALLRALREAFQLDVDDVGLAVVGQRAENDFVGARVGIMDQMAASLADAQTALFLDTRSLKYQRIRMPRRADLLVIHSGISHNHASGEYNQRRAECEEACRLLGVELLRDCSVGDLARINALPEPLAGRARHVVTENARVLEAVAALEDEDIDNLGRLFAASHASMRDDYEVSIPEIDALVEIAMSDVDVAGARMTGGGFGGSVVALNRPGAGAQAGTRIARAYAQRTGHAARVFVPPAQDLS
ncbi:MAG TPA: galactokinase [Chloroflexota bacterium]|nr:galactokinase [Chloroflexota bacterium]